MSETSCPRKTGSGLPANATRRARGRLPLALAVVTLMALSGCVLPIPHRSVERRGLSGRVIDAETSDPIGGAVVRVYYPGPESEGKTGSVATDSRGRFAIPTRYKQHWGIMVGVALNHSLPKRGPSIVPEPTRITIGHPDYLPLRKEFRTTRDALASEDSADLEQAVRGDVYPLTPKD